MLGARIALLRLGIGLSRSELGRQLGISTYAVGMYETGQNIPSPALSIKIAQAFGVTVDYLLTGDISPGGSAKETRTEEVLQVLRIMAQEQ